jgi:predicted RecB family nuclease
VPKYLWEWDFRPFKNNHLRSKEEEIRKCRMKKECKSTLLEEQDLVVLKIKEAQKLSMRI